MIQPTVGRKVWFYRSVADAMDPSVQPLDATVVYVLGDRQVNLRVSDAKGDQTPKLAVQLYQEGDDEPKGEFACWMPYQTEQAKKAAAQERQNTQAAIDALVTQIAKLESEVKELKEAMKPSPLASPGAHPDKSGSVVITEAKAPSASPATLAAGVKQITK